MSGPEEALPVKEVTNLKLETWKDTHAAYITHWQLVDADDATLYYEGRFFLPIAHQQILERVVDALKVRLGKETTK